MGSIASTLDDRAIAKLTPELWQRHKEVVSVFWDSIGRFLDALDVNGFKVYQDGLVADGEDGLRIVRECVSQGSKNYEIVGRLLERGAVLVKTESLSLVKQEYGHITKMTRSKSVKEREVAAIRYKLAQGRLLKQRDEFIAGRINETLAEGETGILFIGAYHNILVKLPSDIKTIQVKETNNVREYHKLIVSHEVNNERFHQLTHYLGLPVLDTGTDLEI
ncbi:MAG: hypothetical protein Q7J06_11990 [Bacteroidales bacterium]|nr:hypothetical protein [Bacteroidales bacterium]